jgi:hypothetical protein
MTKFMIDELLAFVKFPMNAKANAIIFGVLVAFAIVVIINVAIVFNVVNEQQANASTDGLTQSLGDMIRNKVKSELNKSFNQTLSGIDQQPTTSSPPPTTTNTNTTNQQTSKQFSISGANRSTNLNCTNGKCITTTCTDNNCTTTIQSPDNGAATVNSNTTTITIGGPFYKQNDKPTSQKAVKVGGINATEISFSGNGTANSINFKDTGKALIIPRSGEASYIQGNAEIVNVNNSSEKASYAFQEIGQPASDGKIKANGAAFFGSNARGNLAFLNNIVVIYQNQIDKAGNSSLVAWKWK